MKAKSFVLGVVASSVEQETSAFACHIKGGAALSHPKWLLGFCVTSSWHPWQMLITKWLGATRRRQEG